MGREGRDAVRECRGYRQAGADRGIDLVCNTSHEASERRKPLGFDEVSLCFACVQGRFGGLSLVADFGKKSCENQCPNRRKHDADMRGQYAVG